MIRRLLVSLAAASLIAFGTASVASAHDELVGSVPADGYTVTQLPATAHLVFEEETSPDDVTVKVAGHVVPVAASPADPHEVVVDLTKVVATETVTLHWRAVDEHDGHVTTGSFSFHVLEHSGGIQGGIPVPSTPTPTPGFSSIPANGFTVTTLPAVARLTFPTPVDPKAVTVVVAGRSRPVSAAPGESTTVLVDLAGVRATESVTLSWHVAGAHAKRGEVTFHVLDHVSSVGSSANRPAPPFHNLSVLSHVVGYLAMAILLGGLFFVSVLWPAGAGDPRTRRVLVVATLAGGAAAIAAVFVAVKQVAPLPFRDAIAQHFGRVSVSLAVMWLLAVVVVVAVLQSPAAVRRPAWRVGALVVAIGLIRVTGMSAHATQGNDAVIGVLVDFLHLCAVSAWVGGLVILLVGLLPRRQLAELELVVPRFSRLALASVAVVVTSGVVLAIRVIGSIDGLFTTHYGHVLLLKLTLVGLVLVVGFLSKRWVEQTLSQAVAARSGSSVSSFIASVTAETVLVIAVLGVASVLVTANPGM